MDKTGRTTADPVRVLLREPLGAGNDETALGGMVRHISRKVTTTSGHLLGLLEGETISAHENLEMAVLSETHHHPYAWEVVANALSHADAVGTLVAFWRRFQIVVKTVKSTDEGVVELASLLRQFAVAEVNTAVFTDADESPLT